MESQKDKTYFSAFLFLGIFYGIKSKFTNWNFFNLEIYHLVHIIVYLEHSPSKHNVIL